MRLMVHVEGIIEETFVNNVLGPHLMGAGYTRVDARLIGNARRRINRGGGRSWAAVRKGILNHLKGDRDAISTTMVDYYGLQRAGEWPGRAAAAKQPFATRAASFQTALAEDIRSAMGTTFNPSRFIPYVSMHEFEALLFSDCERFAQSIGAPQIGAEMQSVLDQFGDPEEINDSQATAPSKRILAVDRRYDKVAMGTIAIQDIGLESIRRQCRNFGCWLNRLERAANP